MQSAQHILHHHQQEGLGVDGGHQLRHNHGQGEGGDVDDQHQTQAHQTWALPILRGLWVQRRDGQPWLEDIEQAMGGCCGQGTYYDISLTKHRTVGGLFQIKV